jgi:methionyl-tRNA formyltransferase
MGTPASAANSLGRLIDDGHDLAAVYTQPDRPAGRGNKIVFSPVKQLTIDRKIPLLQPAKIRTPEALAEFSGFNADVAVVVAYGRILPDGFLEAFPHGAVNVHFSLLPKYRGAAPVNWAIACGERRTGVTTMKMDSGLDTGDILMTRETEIGRQEAAPQLMERLSGIGAELLSETIAIINDLIPLPQDHSAATYAPILKREDGLIDWSMSAEEISNRVRGFQPFPGTFTYFRQKKLTIWAATPLDRTDIRKVLPGTVISTEGGTFEVSAGRGTTLQVAEVQFEGKRRMAVRDVLNGIPIAPGERFVPSARDDS